MNKIVQCKMFLNKIALICIFSLFFVGYTIAAESILQQKKITISMSNAQIKDILKEIKKQTGLNFIYNEAEFSSSNRKDINVKNSTVEQALRTLIDSKEHRYEIVGNNITIAKNKTNQVVTTQKIEIKINGKVIDGKKPIVGATIIVKGTARGSITDNDGSFSTTAFVGETLEVSCVGFEPQEIIVKPTDTYLSVILKESAMEVDDVVVTGIFTRKSDSFTGSYSTFTSADLKAIGNSNILQSLKTLDPSFNVVESNEFGSDPNRLPDIEIRGKTSMLGTRDQFSTDPNQPLFMLDGFETTLSVINNLDMNRVESIVILKDAASTAIYGSKAANGVVVVWTKKPVAGKLRVGYNGYANMSIPDLTSYNLMNSFEKLEFERLAGLFSGEGMNLVKGEEKYNLRYSDILRGVDTYWLAEPLRVGVNHRHSLSIEGGEGGFAFNIGGNYNGVTGVMKSSNKEVLGANIDLTYTVGKLRFANKLRVDHSISTNPIVTFDNYATANPYYMKYDEFGQISKWLEVFKNNDGSTTSIPNPMYNANLNSRNNSKSNGFTNNFNMEYRPIDELNIRGRFGLIKTISSSEKFTSPNDTKFDKVNALNKGEYSNLDSEAFSYEGELTVSFAKTLNDIHSINFVAGGSMSSRSQTNQGYAVAGFPDGDFTYPSFSAGYKEGTKPSYQNMESRSLSAYLNGGYSLMNKYLFDVSYRLNGSSVFGSSKRYTNTWSTGLAWNIHNESFIKNSNLGISLLKIRGSIGNPGNQNFDSFMTYTTFQYDFNSLNYFGMSSFLSGLGNPNLEWQKTLDKNIGFDLSILNRRLMINADYYHKKTDPLLISINTPLSSGTENVISNLGNQVSQGLTATVQGYLIYNMEERFTWSLRANIRVEKAVLGGIGNKLEALNKYGKENKTLVRYYDGANPSDLWAIKSFGIDPMTGREVFLNKEGKKTYDYSPDLEQIVGNSRPKAEGVFGTSLRYKGFTADINFRYRIKADVFNNALYAKVENIGSLNSNQDKRAYYDRWKKPGDVAKYRDISSQIKSPISSRFVQTESTLTLEALRIGYEFSSELMDSWGLSLMRVDLSMNDVFRASTILSERGTYYPFARSFQVGLSINF